MFILTTNRDIILRIMSQDFRHYGIKVFHVVGLMEKADMGSEDVLSVFRMLEAQGCGVIDGRVNCPDGHLVWCGNEESVLKAQPFVCEICALDQQEPCEQDDYSVRYHFSIAENGEQLLKKLGQ